MSWPFGRYPAGGLVPLGPHVTAFHAEAFPLSNSAIVVGLDATLVFDANCFEGAHALRAAAGSPGPPVRDLVLSHGHDDHWMGSELFSPPARIHARRGVRDRLQRIRSEGRVPGAQYRRDRASAEPDPPVRIELPDALVEAGGTIDLGGVIVRLFPVSPAHTDADLWALVEPDRVALCGDLWYVACEPFVGSGSVRGLLGALETIRDAGARIHLPGHGPAATLGPPASDPASRYLTFVLETTAEEHARGLAGRALGARVRERFEDQRARAGGVDVPYRLPGFLETTTAAAERDLRTDAGEDPASTAPSPGRLD